MSLAHFRSCHFYNKLTEKVVPTAVAKWESYGIQPRSWQNIFEIPYKCTKSTRLQSLHYRIVNRYIPTRKYLSTRGIVGSPLCPKCPEVEDMKHFFFECSDVKPVWEKILRQLKEKFHLTTELCSFQSVILGYPSAPPVVNLILLLIKQYIVTRKIGMTDRPSQMQIENIKAIIVSQAQAEWQIAKKHKKMEKHNKKWELICDAERNILLN